MAYDPTSAGARPYRHLQPFLLRRGAGSKGSSQAAGGRETSTRISHEGRLGGTLRRHPLLRAPHGPQRHRYSKVFSVPVEEGAEKAISGAPGGTREKLEILHGGYSRARILGRLSKCLRRYDPQDRDQ